MRFFLKSLIVAIMAISSFAPAFAAETRVVPANRSSAVFYYYTFMRDTCAYGNKPKFTVTSPPAHGSIKAIWQTNKMGKGSRNCNGKPMKGMLVIYTPNKGYHGPDSVRFVFSGSGGPGPGTSLSNSFKLNISVK